VLAQDVMDMKVDKQYNLIISNPPFYGRSLRSPRTELNLARHDTGLTLTQLFNVVDRLLASDGTFYVLIPASRFEEIIAEAELLHFDLVSRSSVRQTENHSVFREMVGFRRSYRGNAASETITIREHGVYSQRFMDLLRDYYKEFSTMSLQQRMTLYKLREDRADVIVPALLIHINVMRWADAEEIYVPKIGLADGLIHNLYEEVKSKAVEI
jgi:hypothetical protein